ncbi:hypothetical protein F5B22DRAFT_655413 [Xylaria bambusicola]|uniref:uncharacterized protein n=1 Tax=Xylaria bambusicola TaxID=326684 RepID=UPI00200756D7|nr:uncharacterized protein F5B22DRAFT_655413 [Xylaria bambusicola]KAI0526189.1 hypothetical protein F5B22DRAFT_655413 [Xylaria bambusicola]
MDLSDNDEDLITLLRKSRSLCYAKEAPRRIITRGDWESIDIEPRNHLGILKHKPQKLKQHTTCSRVQKHRSRQTGKQQVNDTRPLVRSTPKDRSCHGVNQLVHKSRIRQNDAVRRAKSHGTCIAAPRCDSKSLLLNSRSEEDSYRQTEAESLRLTTPPGDSETKIIQQLQRRQRPRALVVPEYKWAYIVKCIDNADLILDDEDKKKRTMTIKSFADREKANLELHRYTSPETVGGLDAIASRSSALEGPQRLLKVDLQLTNGEHYLFWIEQDMVVLRELEAKVRNQKQWAPVERPKFPHYIVTCDLITYETCHVTHSLEQPKPNEDEGEDSDDEMMSLSSQRNELVFTGTNIDTRIEKLPLMTFTFREMANEYAGDLFLKRSKVDEQAVTLDEVLWWEQNALPKHKKAVAAARKPHGLYEIELDIDDIDMESRLGWSQILVHVHEVPDVVGPVNF